MTVTIRMKDFDLTNTYENVKKVEIMPKESIKEEIDSFSYEHTADIVFRIKLENDEQATFSIDEFFEYEVR